MKMEFHSIEDGYGIERRYIAMVTLNNFRGHANVDVHLFRIGADSAEMEALKPLKLVSPVSPEIPSAILAGATEENALACLLETFTKEEASLMKEYLDASYGDQINSLVFCPMELPIPLGLGPLAKIPESSRAGFINFDLAANYNLPFKFKGYYDLDAAESGHDSPNC